MKYWRARIGLDLIPAMGLAGLAGYFWHPSLAMMLALGAALAGVLAILAAIVTMGCLAVYSSTSSSVVALRGGSRGRVRQIWVWSIGTVIAAAVASLVAMALAESTRLGFVTVSVIFGVLALCASCRAVAWMQIVWAAADRSAQVSELPESLRR